MRLHVALLILFILGCSSQNNPEIAPLTKNCTGQGDILGESGKCCSGLIKIECSKLVDGKCEKCNDNIYCSSCGDNICDPGETICNCPKDCTPEKACVPMNEALALNITQKCCANLNKTQCKIKLDDGSCSECEGFVCTLCGDGICNDTENSCNCPQDCLPEKRDIHCDDKSKVICHSQMPSCTSGSSIPAIYDGCWICADTLTCKQVVQPL